MPKTLTLSVLLACLGLAAQAEVPNVVTDLPPVHSLVAQVMKGVGEPVLLLDRGADAHHFQLRPSQIRQIQSANVIFQIGGGMTPWLDRTVEGIGFSGRDMSLLDIPGTHLRDFDAGESEHDHDHDHESHASDDHAHHDDHGHDHEGTDPHAWLAPANARAWLPLIADALAEVDATNAAAYRDNAAAAIAATETLESELRDLLLPAKGRKIVVFHDAYGYFAEAFDLDVSGSVALGDAATPGADRLRGLRDMIRHDDIACVFPEAQHDPKYLATVTEGTSARIGAALDPEGSTLEPGAGLYPALLRGLAENIAACLR